MPPSLLPSSAALEVFLRAQATAASAQAFVALLPGPAVFVRVDERGGRDEPAPWAFGQLDELPILPPPGEPSDDVFFDVASTLGCDEATATGPAQPPLPLPAARELATVLVVCPGGGRVGRAVDAAVRVRERSVSRQHAILAVEDGLWSIVDLESDNGTSVNGMPLVPGTPHALRSGDVLALGDVVLLFLDGAAFYSHLPALAGG